jgi:protein FRA10AC1
MSYDEGNSTYFSLPITSKVSSVFRKGDNVDPFQKHQSLIRHYKQYTADEIKQTTTLDVLKSNHKFIRDDEDDPDSRVSWETRVAKKYYDKLFKEYCIANLSRYKLGQVAMRWRTKKEVMDGTCKLS